RAGAKERHDVLESLFETRRFARIESWLTDRRRACERDVEASQSSIRQLLARAHEVACDVDPVLEADAEPAAYPAARDSLAGCLDTTNAAADTAREVAAVARGALKQAQHALDAGRDLAALQARHHAGRERLRDLDALRDVVAVREERIGRAVAARSLTPLLEMVDDVDRALDAAAERLAEARDRCSPSVLEEITAGPGGPLGRAEPAPSFAVPGTAATPGVDLEVLEAVVAARRDRRARLELMVEVEAAARAATAQLSAADNEHAALSARRAAYEQTMAALPDLLAEAHGQLAHVAEVAARAPAAEIRLVRAEAVAAAAHESVRLDRELGELTSRAAAAREARAQAHDRWLDLRERRLQGMAAELADRLVEGVACLVCGSPRHPAPAERSSEQVTADDERAAHADFTVASEEYESVGGLESRVAVDLAGALTSCEGLTPQAALAARSVAGEELDAARAAEEVKRELHTSIAALDDRRCTMKAELDELGVACELIRRRCDDQRAELADKQSQLVQELGSDVSAEDALRRVDAELASAAALASAAQTSAGCLRDAAQLHTRLDDALTPAGFADVDQLRAAHLSEAELAVAATLNRTHSDDVRDATRIVADPVLVAAVAQPEPDLADLDDAVQQAEEVRLQTATRAVSLATRRDRLEELLSQLEVALADWHPRLVARDRAAAVAAMCSGTSADNITKTRLSHYVLAARLEQVVAAANLRLSAICSGRYQLEHSMQRGVGDTRGGLGLLVADTYTGQRRDPATLSGGETFYVSLALALGLADLVRDEIDSLRAGGRCVGLVSHLAELRTRIPAQLHVQPGRHGSTIAS
ncbi:MAG: repair protein SbcC/Rad50, partial [Solirubrobacteraceae bacterium]|nr:repair protein SbcC/Rad50 [Solirubrobacteraceae bacterium]